MFRSPPERGMLYTHPRGTVYIHRKGTSDTRVRGGFSGIHLVLERVTRESGIKGLLTSVYFVNLLPRYRLTTW